MDTWYEFKITNSILHLHHPGANELNQLCVKLPVLDHSKLEM